eukprot:358308-Chlamydomonas_euryale.AAC.5
MGRVQSVARSIRRCSGRKKTVRSLRLCRGAGGSRLLRGCCGARRSGARPHLQRAATLTHATTRTRQPVRALAQAQAHARGAADPGRRRA